MDAQAVLIDSVNRPVDAARTVLKEISKETLHAMPGGRANSIAWLVWHSARQMDIQVAWLANAGQISEQLWITDGWGERLGIDRGPKSIGFGDTAEDVAAAIIRAVHGEPVLSARPTEILVNAYQSERRRQRTAQHMRHLVEQLPPRLQGVHARLLKGLTNHQIAEELDISENTVRIYVSDVLHHLGHSSRTELLAAALI